MKPEEQNLLLQALGYAGETLDKPGRFARGLISTALNYATGYGQADEQAIGNIIPFSDYFQITDPKKELNARQLYAPSYGGMNAPGSGQFWPSVGDAVLDMATDPTSYMSLGIVPAVKTGIAGVKAVPKLMGFGAKAAPDIMSAASKVVPDAVTVASKLSPSVVPTLESTSKSFGDVSSAGVNAMETISGLRSNSLGSSSSDTFTNSMKDFPYGDLLKKIEPEVVPVIKPTSIIDDYKPLMYDFSDNYYKAAANAVPSTPKVGPTADMIADLMLKTPENSFDYAKYLNDASAYSQDLGKLDPATGTMGSFASLTNQAPDIGRITDFSTPNSATFGNASSKAGIDDISKTIDNMDLSILNKIPLDAASDTTKAFDYGSGLGNNIVGKSFDDINAEAAAVAAAEVVAPAAKAARTWAGLGVETASGIANKVGNISEQSYENAGRFIRNAVPDQQSLAEQRGQMQSTPSPNNPNRMISPEDPYGW